MQTISQKNLPNYKKERTNKAWAGWSASVHMSSEEHVGKTSVRNSIAIFDPALGKEITSMNA